MIYKHTETEIEKQQHRLNMVDYIAFGALMGCVVIFIILMLATFLLTGDGYAMNVYAWVVIPLVFALVIVAARAKLRLRRFEDANQIELAKVAVLNCQEQIADSQRDIADLQEFIKNNERKSLT